VNDGRAFSHWPLIFILSVIVAIAGCKKSSEKMVTIDSSMVILSGSDITPAGTLSDAGLKKLDGESDKPSLMVIISRARISDAALAQLAKYKNMATLQATGSQLSDAAVDQLKAAVPSLKTIIK